MKKLFIFIALMAFFFCPLSMEAKKKVKEPVIPQMQNYPSATIGEYRLHGGEVVFRSHVILPEEVRDLTEEERKEGLKQLSQMLNGKGSTVYLRNYLVNQESVRAVTFDENCAFDMKLHVPYPMFVYVAPFGDIYMCPDDTVCVNIDLGAKTREEAFVFDGTGLSGEVNRLMRKVDSKYLKNDSYYRIENASQIDSLMMWRDKQVACMDSMVVKMNEGLPELEGCSPLASDIVRTNILVWHMQIIMDAYNNWLEGDYDRDTFWRNYFDFLAPREKYLLDNPLLMISADHFFFNRLEFGALFPLLTKIIQIYPHEFENEKYAQTGDSLQTRGKTFADGIQKIGEQLHVNPNGFSSQVCLMNQLFHDIENDGDIYESYDVVADQVAYIMPYLTNPSLARIATLTYRDFVKKHETKITEDKLLTKGDSIFQRIIEPYKGNVLLVDFWEMSCGPCRSGMLNDREEVEAMKDNPMKFLYITDDDPDKCNKWMDENNIKGEHIFITRSEWSYMQEKFNFSGIPFHVLVDKSGKVRTDGKSYKELMAE